MSADAVAVGPSPSWKPWAAAALVVVGVFFAFGVIADAFAPAPEGPAGSSYATSPGGAAAWAELLTRAGHPVAQLRRPLESASLPPGSALVVLGADAMSSAAGRNLNRFVRGGGRLVIGGGNPTATLPTVLARPPGWTGSGSLVVRRVASLPEVDGVTTVLTSGAGAWTSGPGTPALAGARGPELLVLALGRGRIALLADAAPVENRLLSSADNAQLALNLAGPPGTPVTFAEAIHGYGEATGLAAIPTRWWVVFGGLCLAWAAWALARGRRIGPAEKPAPEPVPPRSAYVDALARALVRGRDRDAQADLLRIAATRRESFLRGRFRRPS
ncbi:MAG TPA: DUF4350 domain-containing protein [Solirubrobacteraceae bacterium]|nr:DUF4350 domain-containing protein [Solirubrobacteraceae bacterium]